MSGHRWKRAKATVEFCHRRRRHRDKTRLATHERFRYAITLSYPAGGDTYLTDVISNRPLREGSHVTSSTTLSTRAATASTTRAANAKPSPLP